MSVYPSNSGTIFQDMISEMGWSSKRNGELLDLMTANHFECLITVDQNIEYQQNIADLKISIIIILARRNRLSELRRAAGKVLLTLANIQRGQIVRVTA